MKLQIALDEQTIEDGLELCEKVREYIDIIEIGTPFIMREGMHAVRAFRAKFPEKEILADAKVMDAGDAETEICFAEGADYSTVLGVTDLLTIKGCVDCAKRYGKKVVVDMICVENVEERVAQLEELGITDIAVHVGIDQQNAGRTPLQELIRLKNCAKKSAISVAGGISLDTVDQYIEAGADVCIVGGGIAHAKNPVAVAKALAEKIHG